MHTRVAGLGLVMVAALAGCGDDTSGAGGGGGAGAGGPTSSAAQVTAGTTSDASSSATDGPSSSSSDAASTSITVVSSTATGGNLACGESPYVEVHLTVTSFVTDAAIEGAELTVDLCPGLTVETDDAGALTAEVSQGAPFLARLGAADQLTMHLGEIVLSEAYDAGVPMFPSFATALFPDWGEDRPSLIALVDVHEDEFEDPEDPCASAEGFEVAVVDHPEAEVTYYSGESTPNPDPDLTSTGPLGIAAFAGLTDTGGDAPIELEATKDGCDLVSFVSYPFTGRHSLENGTVTVAIARVPPIGPPGEE